MDVAGADRKPRVGDHHVEAVCRRVEGQLLARRLGARVTEVGPAVIAVDHPGALVSRVGRRGGRADGRDARDEDDSLHFRRAAGGKGVSGPVHVHRPQPGIVSGAVRDDPRQVEDPGHAGEDRREGVGDGHVAAHDLGAEAAEPGRSGVRPRQRAHLAILRAEGPDELHAQIARGAGDEGDHPADPIERGAAPALGYPFELRRRSSAGRALHS